MLYGKAEFVLAREELLLLYFKKDRAEGKKHHRPSFRRKPWSSKWKYEPLGRSQALYSAAQKFEDLAQGAFMYFQGNFIFLVPTLVFLKCDIADCNIGFRINLFHFWPCDGLRNVSGIQYFFIYFSLLKSATSCKL